MQYKIIELMNEFNVQGLSMSIITENNITSQYYGVLEIGKDDMVKEDTIFSACSMSKLLTSFLTLRLVDEGLLDLDEDINNLLKSWKAPNQSKITLRHLLSHQGGFIDPDNSFSELKTKDIPNNLEILNGNTDYLNEKLELKFKPGSKFEYSDFGYCIIEQIITDRLNKPFKDIMYDYVFNPLNMNNTILDCKINESNIACGHKNGGVLKSKYPIYPYLAAAGLWSTPNDLSTLIIEIINSVNNRGILSKDLAYEMISKHTFDWAGLGVFLVKSNELEVSSLGWGSGYQSIILFYPHLKKGTVIMTNTNLNVHQMNGIIGKVIKLIANNYNWPTK